MTERNGHDGEHPNEGDCAHQPASGDPVHSRHAHAHGRGLTATGRHRKRPFAVLAITATVFIAEVIGGLISGSLALLADAGHMLTDAPG
jgi:Co/Zn/Cd efflux system component